jgi:hypothetical protein
LDLQPVPCWEHPRSGGPRQIRSPARKGRVRVHAHIIMQAREQGDRASSAARDDMATQKIQRWIDLLAALLRRRFRVTLEDLARPRVLRFPKWIVCRWLRMQLHRECSASYNGHVPRIAT